MAAARKQSTGKNLADEIAKRRGKRYPAHAFIAEHFPDYMEVLLDLDYVIRQKKRRFDEKWHELFHIIALAVEMSNPPNQPHLRQHLKKALLMEAGGDCRGADGLRQSLRHESADLRRDLHAGGDGRNQGGEGGGAKTLSAQIRWFATSAIEGEGRDGGLNRLSPPTTALPFPTSPFRFSDAWPIAPASSRPSRYPAR